MTTPKKRKSKEPRPRAPGGTSGPIDREVDESPDAVEHRRESQSGPGATGVPHTGVGAADNPSPVPGTHHMRHTEDEDDDAREAMEDEAYPSARYNDDEEERLVGDEEGDLHEPERDKIDPHIRHER